MMSQSHCSVGQHLNEACSDGSEHYLQPKDEELQCLCLRSGCETITTICKLHYQRYAKLYSRNQRRCCDPLNLHTGKVHAKGLREITLEQSHRHQHIGLIPGKKLCRSCRSSIFTLSVPQPAPSESRSSTEPVLSSSTESSDEPSTSGYPSQTPIQEVAATASLTSVNQALRTIGVTPFVHRKLHQKKYQQKKLKTIETNLTSQLGIQQVSHPSASEEILVQLKEKFVGASKSEKLQILTIVPKSWSVRKTMEEFQTSNWMARKAKKLVAEKGILSSPNPRSGKSLHPDVVKQVTCFYDSDEISRVMPGKKDCITIRDDNKKKITCQKRLLLCNLDEAYRAFHDKFPELKVGFSKFAELRPKYCVVAGRSGTHSVCVCTHHQNVKLMMHAVDIPRFHGSYKHLLAEITCNPGTMDCFLGNCSDCPPVAELKQHILDEIEDEGIDEINYKQWVTTDRSTLETMAAEIDSFCDRFSEKILQLKRHEFIADQQAKFLNHLKSELKHGEIIVLGDFSENYAFVVQDSSQGFHWTNDQATLHPFVIYYKKDSQLLHLNFVVISNSLSHDTIAVYCFQRRLHNYLAQKLQVNKVFYFTDGSSAQYKNRKNFANLTCHKDDFSSDAEWHFFATSHGKGPCDGLGGTVKRLATKASLQRPYKDQIMNAQQLYLWAKENIPGIQFDFVDMSDVQECGRFLENRFSSAVTIQGTKQLHAFYPHPGQQTHVQVKFISMEPNSKSVRLIKVQKAE